MPLSRIAKGSLRYPRLADKSSAMSDLPAARPPTSTSPGKQPRVNPLTVSLPTGEKIDPSMLDIFRRKVALVDNEVMANGALRYVANDLTHWTNRIRGHAAR